MSPTALGIAQLTLTGPDAPPIAPTLANGTGTGAIGVKMNVVAAETEAAANPRPFGAN